MRDRTVKAVRVMADAQPTGFSHVAPVRQRACPGSYHLFEECFHIKHRLSCEDVIGSPGQLVSHDSQGFCLPMFFLESGAIYFCFFVSSQEEDGSFGEGPLEVDVADFCARASLLLSSRFPGRFHESAIGGKALDFGKALNVVDFVEDGQAEYAPYPVDGPYSEIGIPVMLFGEGRYFLFELREDGIVEIEKVQVELDTLLNAFIREELSDSFSLRFSADIIFDIRQVVLIGGVLDVSQKFGSFSGEIHSAAEQIAGRAHPWRVDVSHGEHASSDEHGDFLGVDSVVLCLSSVNGFHVEGVTENERNTFFLTQIGQPVPGEGALDCDHEVVSVLFDGFQEYLPVGLDVSMQQDRALFIDDAEVHCFCMQVDSAIILVLFRVKSHSVPPCVVVETFIIPSGVEQGGLNEYQGAAADMACLHFCPYGLVKDGQSETC
jgi:hypothetical protein